MDIYRETMLVRIMAFKGSDSSELYDEQADVLEITDVTATHVEVAFDHVRGERIYVQLPMGELLTRALAWGKKPETT